MSTIANKQTQRARSSCESNLDLDEFEVCADKSSTESENEGTVDPVTSAKTPRSPATASTKNYRQ